MLLPGVFWLLELRDLLLVVFTLLLDLSVQLPDLLRRLFELVLLFVSEIGERLFPLRVLLLREQLQRLALTFLSLPLLLTFDASRAARSPSRAVTRAACLSDITKRPPDAFRRPTSYECFSISQIIPFEQPIKLSFRP
ncbi:hypothetical protein [Streptomyces cyaneofuscatus]